MMNLIAYANIITAQIAGLSGIIFYIPRGPVVENFKFQISNFKSNPNDKIQKFIKNLVELAKKNNAGWIRVEPNTEEELDFSETICQKILR